MISAFTYILFGYSAVLAVWGLVDAVRNRASSKYQLWFAAGLLVLLVVQLIVSIAMWGQAGEGTDAILFFGYLLTAIVLMPMAWFWAYAELTRWGPAVMFAAGATVFVMVERMDQLWV